MNDAKYIGLDVHQATISAAVRDSAGKLVMESSSKQKRAPFCSLSTGCVAACMSPSKKAPGRAGCTPC